MRIPRASKITPGKVLRMILRMTLRMTKDDSKDDSQDFDDDSKKLIKDQFRFPGVERATLPFSLE